MMMMGHVSRESDALVASTSAKYILAEKPSSEMSTNLEFSINVVVIRNSLSPLREGLIFNQIEATDN